MHDRARHARTRRRRRIGDQQPAICSASGQRRSKISRSRRRGVVDDHEDSVCGLKYVPGRSAGSSSSKRRELAMRGLYHSRDARRGSLTLSVELGELAARPRPRRPAAPCRGASRRALRASTSSRISPTSAGSTPGRVSARELGLDVQRRLAAARAALVAGLEHLADLLVALGCGRRPTGSPRPSAPSVEREAAPADLLVDLARAHERHDRHDRADDRPPRRSRCRRRPARLQCATRPAGLLAHCATWRYTCRVAG